MRGTPDRSRSEAGRRWIVRLVGCFYLALLGEGVLRKWLLPGASNVLVFVRDPIMLAILVAYIRRGPSPESRTVLRCVAAAAVAFVLCAACQAMTTSVPLPVLLVGVRNYLLFVPLCFAIRDTFSARDYAGWIRLNLWLALPIALLVAVQYRSPPSAFVNAVPGGGDEGVFLLVADVVRPYGVFSFTLGHSAFAAWMAGVALAALVARPRLAAGPTLAAVGTAAIAAMGVLSGSRTYFVLVAAVAGAFVAIAILVGPPRAKATGLVSVGGLAILTVAAVMLVPSLLDNLLERQATATASEGATGDRLMVLLTDFAAELGRVPSFGYGLGSGTNIANFLANGRTDHVLAEYELTRIVQELGPVFALLYIGLRWGFLAWVVAQAIWAGARGNLQPACFVGFLVPVFLAHDITLQNTMIGIGWFAAGIALSAARVGQPVAAPAEWPRDRTVGATT